MVEADKENDEKSEKDKDEKKEEKEEEEENNEDDKLSKSEKEPSEKEEKAQELPVSFHVSFHVFSCSMIVLVFALWFEATHLVLLHVVSVWT